MWHPGPVIFDEGGSLSTAAKLAIAVLVVLGILSLFAGYTYLHVQATHLPSILGPIHGAHYHRHKRGLAGIVGGIILLLAAVGVFVAARRAGRATQVS
jgi:hypothetical protein